jgi:transposase
MDLKGDWLMRLDTRRLWDGSVIGPALRARLAREWKKVELYTEQIAELETQRKERVKAAADDGARQAKQLFELKGIGLNSAWLYVMEFFGWRRFRNRRELASLAGLTPTPHQSGTIQRERGITKAGNRHVRSMAIEIAWCWVRFQPQSALSRWYQRRFGGGGSRLRRIGIVALARRLLIDLWRYLETGALPEGAELKPQLKS